MDSEQNVRRVGRVEQLVGRLYRCGWCGNPTDASGRVLTYEQASAMTGDWDTAEPTSGACCPNGDGSDAADMRRDEFDRQMRADAFGDRS